MCDSRLNWLSGVFGPTCACCVLATNRLWKSVFDGPVRLRPSPLFDRTLSLTPQVAEPTFSAASVAPSTWLPVIVQSTAPLMTRPVAPPSTSLPAIVAGLKDDRTDTPVLQPSIVLPEISAFTAKTVVTPKFAPAKWLPVTFDSLLNRPDSPNPHGPGSPGAQTTLTSLLRKVFRPVSAPGVSKSSEKPPLPLRTVMFSNRESLVPETVTPVPAPSMT